MTRFGIFIGFGPTIELQAHGIGRLLATLVDGASQSGDARITVLAPAWYRRQLIELLEDHKLDPAELEIVTTQGVPIGVRLLQGYMAIRTWRSRERRRRGRGRVLRVLRAVRRALLAAKRILQDAFLRFVSSASPLAWLAAALLAPLALLALLISVPLVLGVEIARRAGRRLVQAPAQRVFHSAVFGRVRSWLRSRLVPAVSSTVEQRERERMVRIANARPDIPVWYVPTIYWPEVQGLSAPKVVAAPDIVYAEFPNYFTADYFRRTKARIMATVSGADRLLCYSNHVAQHHLVRYAGADPARITVLHHGAVRLDKYLKAPGDMPVLRRQAAVERVRQFQATRIRDAFWSHFRFEEAPFVVYSSQYRPYKNFHGLVRAMGRLVHEQGVNIRLVTTADFHLDGPEIGRLVADMRLEDFVLSVPRIPSQTLAAFNHLAVCSVNPTLFEGGFPFTFTEAYSVGTPSVMSRIPAVMERMPDGDLADLMLFDPYDPEAMADRILYAMENRDELLARQRPLYEAYEDWSAVAKRYISTILETR